MALAFLFQLRTYTALRARLAAFLVLAFLAIGMLDVVAYRGSTPRPPVASTLADASPLRGQNLTNENPLSQLRQLGRQRSAAARPPRFEEIHAVSQNVEWPDLEKGAPTYPRLTIRKIPSDEDADSDDADHATPATGYSSRAPPTLT